MNPIAVALTEAKLVTPHWQRVIALADSAIAKPPRQMPQGDFWTRCFDPETLREICSIREALLKDRSAVSAGLRAVMLGILHGPIMKGTPTYLSNQMPRTYSTKPEAALRYWRKHRLFPSRVDVAAAVRRRAKFTFSELPKSTPGEVWHGEAVEVLRGLRRKFHWIITSPPYLGMRTYRADQWLRNWFLGGPTAVEYGKAPELVTINEDLFIEQLGEVWEWCAKRSNPGAHLVVRFGALPSVDADPRLVLRESLRESSQPWRITTMVGAGSPPQNARQATQFAEAGKHVEEVDCYAILDV